ncbi:hypothetical protein [Paraburkholderia caribensis]|uniref:hypothetical protein n=1 Tax=Paraburkholderia caribensis TaxID=75105 RepID=UPI00285640D1|nr:hypothetical protein [Paraburkholderia caribensis]MDR6381794.1 hypothetical protein [Paraburkholderia caribensis]
MGTIICALEIAAAYCAVISVITIILVKAGARADARDERDMQIRRLRAQQDLNSSPGG